MMNVVGYHYAFEEFSKDESRTEDVSIVESDTYKVKY